MEYSVDLRNDGFFFPLTERWIVDTFNISLEQAIIYQMILNKGYIVWTLDWLSKVLGYSRNKLLRQLDDMVNRDILIRYTMTIDNGSKKRTIYVAAYTKEGKRPENQIASLIHKGKERLLCDYGKKRYYRKSN